MGKKVEVILLQDVPKLGTRYRRVRVTGGYARNYLIPRGLAIEATPQTEKHIKHIMAQEEAREQRLLHKAQQWAQKLAETPITIKVKAGTSGKIFGSISQLQVARQIKEQLGIEVQRRNITLLEDISTVGTYRAKVRLHPQVETTITLQVEEEK